MAVLDVTQSPFLAKGDGKTDDTAAIQLAISTAGIGDTVWVPPSGTFMVNPLANALRLYYGSPTGLALKSSLIFKVDGVLQAIPDASDHYAIILIDGCAGVTLTGKGKIIGDRAKHMAATPGQWGFGVALGNAQNVQIVGGLTISECYGDGITMIGSSNVLVDHITLDSHKRQNMSLISVDGVVVTNNTFLNAGDAALDIEPDANDHINNVRVQFNTFKGSGGPADIGIGSAAPGSTFSKITVNNNQHDMRMQPIWVHDNAGVTGISPWAAALKAIFYEALHAPYYRFWGYPTTWSKA